MKMSDSLNKEKYQYNLSGFHLNHATKMAMQTMYRNQLDELVQEKQKQKNIEKEKILKQKQQYNEVTNYNQQTQKMKDQAYKNYYGMLINNQQQMQSSYVNPYSIRDSLKDQHIQYAVHEGQEKNNRRYLEEKRRHEEMRTLYRNQLKNQLQERQKLQNQERKMVLQQKQEQRKYGRSPNELKEDERLRHLGQMAKYKSDLDKVQSEKYVLKNKSFIDHKTVQLPLEQHNPLINPVPFNVQNPYIKKEMERQSYFARVANQNFSR